MLNKKDQKIIRQMMRHIRTFPLLDSEIRQFERDLTGMALEAEKRGEDFEDVLDMTPTEFCDELLYSIGGSKAPGGRYLLKGAGIYYQLTGILGTALFSLILLLALFYTIIIPSELAQTGLLVLFVAAIGLTFFWLSLSFGNIAERDCGTTEKSAQLVNNGKILLVTAVIFDIVVTLYMIFNAGASVGHFNYKLPLLMQVIIFFSCYMPAILYIIGAKRNLPREYVLNEL